MEPLAFIIWQLIQRPATSHWTQFKLSIPVFSISASAARRTFDMYNTVSFIMFLSNQLTRCDVNVAWKLDVTWIWGATVHDDCAFSRRQCCLGSCFSSSSSFRALMSNEPGCSYPWLHLIPFHLPERSRFFFPLKMLMTKVESWGQRQRCCFGGCDSSLEEKQIRSFSGRRTPAAFRPEIPFFFFFFFSLLCDSSLFEAFCLLNCPQCQDPAVTSYTDQHYLFMGWVSVVF